MKARIGIGCGFHEEKEVYFLKKGYTEALARVGGIPLLLPFVGQEEIPYLLEGLEGIILSGGGDPDPSLYGEEPRPGLGEVEPARDLFELTLVSQALKKGLPLLAVCRGMQLLNVALGGSLIQDLASEEDSFIKHRQQAPDWYPGHGLQIEEESLLFKLLGKRRIRVNSFHHQAVKRTGEGLEVTAISPADGVIEAVEGKEHPFLLGVQWHPELMWQRHQSSLLLFQGLVKAARGES